MILLVLFSINVHAEEYTFSLDEIGSSDISGEWGELIASLPEDVREELAEYDPTDISRAGDVIGEKSSAGFWIGKVWDAVICEAPKLIGSIVPMFSAVILMSASKSAVSAIASEKLFGAYLSILKLVGVISVFGMTSAALNLATSYLSRVCGIMNTLTPVMEGVCLASGSLTEMTVTSQALMLIVTVIGNVNAHILSPIVSAMVTLSAVSAVCSEAKIDGFIRGAGRLLMRLWQITAIFFSFVLTSQSLIARSADSLGGRAVKFALGSFIPVAGGMIAEAYQTVRGGLSFIKSATGIGGIIVLILILVSGIVPLLLYKFALSLGSVTSEMIGLSEMSSFMEQIRSLMDFLIAIVLYTSLMFILALVIFAGRGVA